MITVPGVQHDIDMKLLSEEMLFRVCPVYQLHDDVIQVFILVITKAVRIRAIRGSECLADLFLKIGLVCKLRLEIPFIQLFKERLCGIDGSADLGGSLAVHPIPVVGVDLHPKHAIRLPGIPIIPV